MDLDLVQTWPGHRGRVPLMDIIDGGYTAHTHEYSEAVLQVVPPLRTTDKSSASTGYGSHGLL